MECVLTEQKENQMLRVAFYESAWLSLKYTHGFNTGKFYFAVTGMQRKTIEGAAHTSGPVCFSNISCQVMKNVSWLKTSILKKGFGGLCGGVVRSTHAMPQCRHWGKCFCQN